MISGIINDDKISMFNISTAERSDVYRIIDKQRKYDPGQGRTTSHNSAFYKHAIPPGLNMGNNAFNTS